MDSDDNAEFVGFDITLRPRRGHRKSEQQRQLHHKTLRNNTTLKTQYSPQQYNSKSVVKSTELLSFKDIGGLASQINVVKETILLPLIYPQLFKNNGLKMPKGLLFNGEPGTGKTMLARVICDACKSMTGEHVNFYLKNASEVMNSYVGESEKVLRQLFQVAEENTPSIIFIDELDAIGVSRSERNDQVYTSILTTLLTLMDGLNQRGQVIVIAATNRIDTIDKALLRPGRFDRILQFTVPDLDERRQTLEICYNKVKCAKEVLNDEQMLNLAKMTEGYNYSRLHALFTDTYLNKIRELYPEIYTMERKVSIDYSLMNICYADLISSLSI